LSASSQTVRVRLTDSFILDMQEMIAAIQDKLPDPRSRAYFEEAKKTLTVSRDGFYDVGESFYYTSFYLLDWTLLKHGMRLASCASLLTDGQLADANKVVQNFNPAYAQYLDQMGEHKELTEAWADDFESIEDFYIDALQNPRFDAPKINPEEEEADDAQYDFVVDIQTWHVVVFLVICGALVAYFLS
jgi:hypothetical protein